MLWVKLNVSSVDDMIPWVCANDGIQSISF
jgi:hypothetical protein